MANKVEDLFERGLFAARWLAAPIYAGLILCLLILLFIIGKYTLIVIARMPTANSHDAVVAILSFIDLALVANLILIVLYTSYESFVSRLEIDDHPDKPAWIGKVDFSGLKLKLFASIAAISGIELLKEFMDLRETKVVNGPVLTWLVIIHSLFLVTMIFSALSQKWGDHSHD
jgi:uncharacterized protein (TIGR00645 family)